MKKRIVVAGGTGYIGSHTVVELIENGYEVVIIDNLHNSEASVVKRIESITGVKPILEVFDICDTNRLSAFFNKYDKVDAIIHFAAMKAVGESISKPLEYYRNNLGALMNILHEMRDHEISSMVFSSSCTVYGEPKQLPVAEDSPLQTPPSPYGNTKRISEDILRDTTTATEGMGVIALRYFNPIGAHPSALIGEMPRGVPENLVPYITQTAYGLRKELKVYGNDYNTPDGSCIRDFIHVVDLAKAHVLAVKRLIDKKNRSKFEIYNIGTGKGVSVLEAIASFERISGIKLAYNITARRPGDIEKIWADPTLANYELGWRAKSTLDEAMKTAWEWEKNVRASVE